MYSKTRLIYYLGVFMKRIGNLYHKVYDMDNLLVAHKFARRGKGWYEEVKLVDSDPDYYLGQLQQMLIDKTYETSEYLVFEKKEGNKIRVLSKLPYIPDRMCHWGLLRVIGPTLQRTLVDTTFSALAGRGPHLAWIMLQDALYHKKETKYCLKFDIKQYYPSIQHDILKGLYRRLFKDPNLIWLIDEIIDSIKCGIPIGNYMSQWSGNIYLSPFDHWCKEVMGCRYYFRYMDDIVIMGESKDELHRMEMDGREWLARNLRLRVKGDYQVFPTRTRGLDFVGYRFFDGNILLRKSTAMKFKRKMRWILKKCLVGIGMSYHDYCSVNSYKGWIKWCNGDGLVRTYIELLEPYMNEFYEEVIKNEESTWITGNCAIC